MKLILWIIVIFFLGYMAGKGLIDMNLYPERWCEVESCR